MAYCNPPAAGLSSLIYDPTWLYALRPEFQQDYFPQLQARLYQDYAADRVIYPQPHLIFNALNLTPLNEVKVVILGQDPYHNGQAEGLAFSVPDANLPRSLTNIFKVLAADIPGFTTPPTGSLVKWAQQGVLLLNATLTVEANNPNSHKDYGWQILTDRIIQIISDHCPNAVFILWGKVAHLKEELIDQPRHLVITDVHPALRHPNYRHFQVTKTFSLTNEYLVQQYLNPINWYLVP